MSDNGVYSKLSARFPAEAHKTKRIGGTELVYVTGEMVFARLNEVLGFDGWSFEVRDVKVLDNEVWALGCLTVYSGDRAIVREQAGGQIINRNKAGDVIELSNDIKGAVTDAAKKCATLIGVGLYLYDQEERREVQAEMREAARPKPAAPRPLPTSSEAVRAAAMVTGAAPAETIRERWARLVAEAEAVNLPTWKGAKGIDPGVLSDAQLTKYADSLEAKIAGHKAA